MPTLPDQTLRGGTDPRSGMKGAGLFVQNKNTASGAHIWSVRNAKVPPPPQHARTYVLNPRNKACRREPI